jgi:hypothetical protein
MKRMIQCLQQNLIFFMLISAQLESNQQKSYIDLPQIRSELENLSQLSDQDEKLVQDLLQLSTDLYKKTIEITVLYFSGMLMNSNQFHKQLLFEGSKYVLYASQLIAEYLPKLLRDPKITWQVKLKRCAYITSTFVIIILLLKEYHKNINDPDFTNSMRTYQNLQISNDSALYVNNYVNNDADLKPRLRPSLS